MFTEYREIQRGSRVVVVMARGAAQGALPVKVNKNILCVSAVFKLREIFRPFYRWLLPRLLLLFLLLLLLLLLRRRRLLLLLYGNFSIFFICIVWGALCFVSNAYGKLTFKACSHPLPPPRPLFSPSLFVLFARIYRRCGEALGSCLRH